MELQGRGKEEDMAILVMFEINGMDSSKYDEAIRQLTEVGLRVPDGTLWRQAAPTGD